MKIRVLAVGAGVMVGGIPGYVARLASLCDPDRIEFHMTVSGPPEPQVASRFSGIIKHQQPIDYSLLSLPTRVNQLRQLIQRERIHVLHLHAARAGFLGCLAASGLQIGTVYTGHGWRFEQKPDRIRQALFWVYEKYICARSDAVVFITERSRELGLARRLVDERKAVMIHTRIDAGPFAVVDSAAVAAQRKALGIPQQARVIGTVARIADVKDPLTFVRTAARIKAAIPNAYFLWVGDGEMRNETTALAHELGLDDRLIITGLRPENEVPVLLRAMDVYLCTSRIEVMPLSILEAQATRLLVVCSGYLGSDEVVQHTKTGYVFPLGDYGTAANLVVRALHMTAEVDRVVCQAHDQFTALHADPSRMARAYENVYAGALGSCRHNNVPSVS